MLPHYVRLTRAAVIAEAGREYVTSSRIAGAGTLRLMFDTILPNCAAPLIVQATLGFSNAILDAAALGFLGLGAQPPTPEWGSMLASALEFIQRAPWVVTFPGLAILITVLAFNLTGRRPARRARSEAAQFAGMSTDSIALLEIDDLRVEFGTPQRPVRRRRRRRPVDRRRRGRRPRRRIGLGQERDRARAAGPGRLSRAAFAPSEWRSPAAISSTARRASAARSSDATSR